MEPKSVQFNDLQYTSSGDFWLHYSALIYSPWKSRNKSLCQQHTDDVQVGWYYNNEKQISNHSGNPCQQDQGKRNICLTLTGKEGHLNVIHPSAQPFGMESSSYIPDQSLWKKLSPISRGNCLETFFVAYILFTPLQSLKGRHGLKWQPQNESWA